jgi:CubicO group peptidase (beta-lactamase class C family)
MHVTRASLLAPSIACCVLLAAHASRYHDSATFAHSQAASPGLESAARTQRSTHVSIVNGRWHLNGAVTYPGAKAEGLLMNVRMVNAVFEDANDATRRAGFSADANTDAFIARIPEYMAAGVRAFTLGLQGGMPGYEGAVNSAFNPDGSLRDAYLARVRRVIEACDRDGAVVILGAYYQRQDQILEDDAAVRAGIVNVARWIESNGFTNVVLEIANEFAHRGFDHAILKDPLGQAELIALAKKTAPRLLVSTAGMGSGMLPDPVARASDFLLIHFNTTELADIPDRINALKKYGKPIVCNEDDKLDVDGAAAAERSVEAGASWGFMHSGMNQYVPLRYNGAEDDPVVYRTLRRLTTAAEVLPIHPQTPLTYFPAADTQGGWRSLKDADQIRRVAGIDRNKLDEALAFVKGSTRNGGLLVVRRGWLVYEEYFGLGHRDATPNLASVGKSFTSIAVGILLSERPNQFPQGLDQEVFTPAFLPPEAFPLTDPRKAKIKLGQLLAMTAGIRGNNPVHVLGKEGTIDPAGPDGALAATDMVAVGKDDVEGQGRRYSTETLWCEPGGGYSYATSSIHVASMVLRHVTGMELQQYVDSRLARPLGWGTWGFGYRNVSSVRHTPGGGGIAVRATDMLRFGYLLLREGRWHDAQLVPAEYVRASTRQSPYNPHYPYSLQFNVNTNGNHADLPRDAFWKSGSGGHAIYVVPSLDLVVWKLGGRDGQFSPDNTGLPPSPAPREQVDARDGWKATVDPETALRTTLRMVIDSIATD